MGGNVGSAGVVGVEGRNIDQDLEALQAIYGVLDVNVDTE